MCSQSASKNAMDSYPAVKRREAFELHCPNGHCVTEAQSTSARGVGHAITFIYCGQCGHVYGVIRTDQPQGAADLGD